VCSLVAWLWLSGYCIAAGAIALRLCWAEVVLASKGVIRWRNSTGGLEGERSNKHVAREYSNKE
jgi:hypothetical protein